MISGKASAEHSFDATKRCYLKSENSIVSMRMTLMTHARISTVIRARARRTSVIVFAVTSVIIPVRPMATTDQQSDG
jgi:hypothetical protein